MERPLRKGWTTGACAAAAAKAAWTALVSGVFPDPVGIILPRGQTPQFSLRRAEQGDGWAVAGVVKDAGDDPDVTHGAEIVARLERIAPGSGIVYCAGPGVGTVTLPGLPLAVGEPAINPGPRAQIEENLRAVGQSPDVRLTISIPGGEALARQTMNGRLGIVGGLSVLGTTGVVIPYSCAAWVHSIHRGVDVARSCGLQHVAGCTGKTSEAAVRRLHGLDERAMIDMGGFAGALLKYLRGHPVRRLTLGGGFAKMGKLAAGGMDLHSKASAVDIAWLVARLAELGAADDALSLAAGAVSASQVLSLAEPLPLGQMVAGRAREAALAVLAGGVEVDVVVLNPAGKVIGHAG
jgi:cobalt-precorrin-5B (C1)-methyltransferase